MAHHAVFVATLSCLACFTHLVAGTRDPGGAEMAMEREGTPWPLKMAFFTWNMESRAEKIPVVVERLGDKPSDVLVTCQTEAIADMESQLLDKGWIPVAGGRHSGSTGINGKLGVDSLNEQILSVFVRSSKWSKAMTPQKGASMCSAASAIPSSVGKLANSLNPALQILRADKAFRFLTNAGGFLTHAGAMCPMTVNITGTADVFMSTTSTTVSSDWKGKGGVFATLSFQDGFSLQVACAHLDSKTADVRTTQVKNMLQQMEEEHPSASKIVLGDLNYRLSRDHTNKTEVMDLLVSSDKKWSSLAIRDPLNPGSKFGEKASLISAYDFECNQPHGEYLPTYKRDPDALHLLAPFATRDLYSKGLDKDKRAGELELGWLDRLCWKVPRNSGKEFVLEKDEGWQGVGGSDHMAVSWEAQLKEVS